MFGLIENITVVRPRITRTKQTVETFHELRDAAEVWHSCIEEQVNAIDTQVLWTNETMSAVCGDCLTCFVPYIENDVVTRVTDAVFSNRFRAACVISAAPFEPDMFRIPTIGKTINSLIIVEQEDMNKALLDPRLQYHKLGDIRNSMHEIATSLISRAA
jgi:hypothetical protein